MAIAHKYLAFHTKPHMGLVSSLSSSRDTWRVPPVHWTLFLIPRALFLSMCSEHDVVFICHERGQIATS